MFARLHALVVLALACPCARGQTTWYVDPKVSGPGTGTLGDPYASLQFALVQQATVSGDTIEVFPGTLFENVVHPADKDDLTFRAIAGKVVIDGAGFSSCYRSLGPGVSTITFEGEFTFRNGVGSPSSNGSVGGGLRVQNGADLVLDGSLGGVRVVSNTADRGAGVYVADGDLRLTGCFVSSNDALGGPAAGGGVYFTSSSGADLLRLEESFVSNNRAGLGGGIHVSNATLEASFTQISNNSALALSQLGKAGGVAAVDSVVQLGIEAFVRANLAEGTGGGLALESSRLELSNGGGVLDNRAEPLGCSGGALGGGVLGSCDSEIVGQGAELIEGNYACFEGGGVHGCAAVTGVILRNNSAQFGGGAHGGGCDPMYTDCVLELNYGDAGTGSAGFGGGIYGPASVFDSTIENNLADGDGGGAHSATLQNCDVLGNRTNGLPFSPPAAGGGLFGCVATDCLISGNEAQLGGGAAYSTLAGVEVRENRAHSPFDSNVDPSGGGVFWCNVATSSIVRNMAVSEFEGVDPQGGGAAYGELDRVLVLENSAVTSGIFYFATAIGGGILDSTAVDCELRGNLVESENALGGGAAGGTLERCLVVDNSAYFGGGAFDSILERCTVVENEANYRYDAGYFITARNCIFFANKGVPPDELGSSTVTYSLVEGGHVGVGNIDADPLLVDAANGDYHLRFDSPCIDAGDPTTFDDDGSIADMGAFPFDPLYDRIGTTSCTSNPNSTGQDAILTTYGSLIVADNLVLFQVTQLPANKFGYMLMSATSDYVPLFGGGQGDLCLGAPQIRFNQFVLNTGPGGVVGFQPDLTNLPQGTTIQPGEDWYFQFWYRDNNPQLTNNTSSANQLLFQ